MESIRKRCPRIIYPSDEYYRIPVNFEYDRYFRGNRDHILKHLFENNGRGKNMLEIDKSSKLKYGPQLKLDLHGRFTPEGLTEWGEFVKKIKNEDRLGIFLTIYWYEGDTFKKGRSKLVDNKGHAIVCMIDFRDSNKLYIFDPNGDRNNTIDPDVISTVTVRGRRGKNVEVSPDSVNIGLLAVHRNYSIIELRNKCNGFRFLISN